MRTRGRPVVKTDPGRKSRQLRVDCYDGIVGFRSDSCRLPWGPGRRASISSCQASGSDTNQVRTPLNLTHITKSHFRDMLPVVSAKGYECDCNLPDGGCIGPPREKRPFGKRDSAIHRNCCRYGEPTIRVAGRAKGSRPNRGGRNRLVSTAHFPYPISLIAASPVRLSA